MARMSKLTEPQRRRIPAWSLTHNGWGDGTGYPGRRNNPACNYVGHGLEYSCADGVTATFGHAGYPLISMQPGMAEGYAYCPDALIYGQKNKAIINSWNAKIGDVLLIHTGSRGAQPGHTEVVYDVTGTGKNIKVWSVGWDSGPSNVDHFTGQGGVHKHVWSCPEGVGNQSIMAVLNADKIIDWPKVEPTAKVRRRKRLKPTPIHKTATSEIHDVTHRLGNRVHPVAPGGSRHSLHALIAAARHALRLKEK